MDSTAANNKTRCAEHTMPQPAVRLARRMMELASKGNGRHRVELVVVNGAWAIIVNDGKLEYLGK